MITADMIPDEVVEAAKTTYTAEIYKGQATNSEYHTAMLEAIAAALNAWPGRSATGGFDHDGNTYAWVQIPLKQDASA